MERDIKRELSGLRKFQFAAITLIFLFVVVIILSEIILYFTKYETVSTRMRYFSMAQAKWWTCDSLNGPRYVANKADVDDSTELAKELWYFRRLNIVNSNGYHDKDEFLRQPEKSDSLRILFAGDSFTWGASADVDSSYVEVFDREINKKRPSLIWNTAIPATGTNHAVFTVKKFLPLQHSDLVVLGFYVGNDFSDNLLPFDRLVFNEKATCVNLYRLDRNLQPYGISDREAYKMATGSYPREEIGTLQKILNGSRVYSFYTDMKEKVLHNLSGRKSVEKKLAYQRTREYLSSLDVFTKGNNARLVVVVIPSGIDINSKTGLYENAIRLLKDLKIDYFEPLSLFSKEDYLIKGGGHWNNAGHGKAGKALGRHVIHQLNLN